MTTSYLNKCLFEPSRAVVRIVLIIKKQLFTCGHKLGGLLARDNPEPGVVKEPLDTVCKLYAWLGPGIPIIPYG